MIQASAVVVCKTSKQHTYTQQLEIKWSSLGHRIVPPSICGACGDPVGYLEIMVTEVRQNG